jgi:hypothetical protein
MYVRFLQLKITIVSGYGLQHVPLYIHYLKGAMLQSCMVNNRPGILWFTLSCAPTMSYPTGDCFLSYCGKLEWTPLTPRVCMCEIRGMPVCMFVPLYIHYLKGAMLQSCMVNNRPGILWFTLSCAPTMSYPTGDCFLSYCGKLEWTPLTPRVCMCEIRGMSVCMFVRLYSHTVSFSLVLFKTFSPCP